MEIFFKFIKEYSLVSGIIMTGLASFGWVLRNLFEIFVENRKYKKELKTYFWKEKITASKKATEFYMEYSNLLNLIRIQFENHKIGNLNHKELIDNFQNEVVFYSSKLKSFPHFEYHHINLFYDFENDKTMEIGNNIISVNRKILELEKDESNIEKAKDLFGKLEENYTRLLEIQKERTNKVRND
jgi:hypothetical protein